MKGFEVKNLDHSEWKDAPFDVDDKSRRVKVALNKVGVKDHDSDIIEKTAFDKTIRERGPKGKGLIWHLTDHHPSLKSAVGRFKELFMEGDYLVGITDVPSTTWGNDVMEFYKTGHINQHSIGFRVMKRETVNEDDRENRYDVLKEIMLYEGSAVLWGANENTPTLTVGKSLTREEAIDEYSKTMDELRKMHKLFEKGHLSDESYELVEIKMSQLTSKLQQLFEEATQPAVKAVEPDKDDLLDVFKTFNNNLKQTGNETRGIETRA